MTICSCHHKDHKHFHKKHKQSIANKDTLFVIKRSAISVWLDTATLEKRRKKYGDDGFYTAADDDVYYSSIADSFLKARQLPVIYAREYKYVKFVQKNNHVTLIKVDTLAQIFTMYFFDPSVPPHDVDVTDMDDEYNEFFHFKP